MSDPTPSPADDFVAMLRCPKCQHPVVRDADRLVCTDPATRLAYPVRDNIPVMVVEQATTLSPDEWEAVVGRAETETEL